MKLEIKLEKNKGHQIYRLKNGKRVPGATTIKGILDKPALKYWANNLGLEGINVRSYVDSLADVGTLAHAMIEADMTGKIYNYAEWSKEKISLGENAMLKYYEWRKDKKIIPIENEIQLVSEAHRYGGTIDIFCELDGKKTLIDIKTSKAIYNDVWLQIAAYKNLLIENGYPVEKCMILRVGRDENENGFDAIPSPSLDRFFDMFILLRRVYDYKKDLNV